MKYLSFSYKFFLLLCCLSPSREVSAQTDPATATVYFMRSVGAKAASGAFNVFIDDVMVCKLNEGRFLTRQVPAGVHYVSVQSMGKKSSKKIDKTHILMEAGKTYYIQTVMKFGDFLNYVSCREVTANSSKLLLPKLKEDKSCTSAD